MHTRAADSQTLHNHLLAYVKQYPLTAKTQARVVALLIAAFALSTSACATLPRQVVSETPSTLDIPKAESGLRININTASAQDLEKLPGIGKAIAERILAHRTQYGPFRRPEHLMMVRGISDGKFRKIRMMIVVDD